VLPVYNEAETIAATIQEIFETLSGGPSFVVHVSEDGSSDGTKRVLSELERSFPIEVTTHRSRKGYSQAVADAMATAEAPYTLVMDSDGQFDPRDFPSFWERRQDADVIAAWRVERADVLLRRALSRGFYRLYRMLFRVPLHDPSCGYVLVKTSVAKSILPRQPRMPVGFFWEFAARSHRAGLSLAEVPIQHRTRRSGETRVYALSRLPGIAFREVRGLIGLWLETRSLKARPETAAPVVQDDPRT
jgi:glycosyltransferase involved in cell wall biosynthesis